MLGYKNKNLIADNGSFGVLVSLSVLFPEQNLIAPTQTVVCTSEQINAILRRRFANVAAGANDD